MEGSVRAALAPVSVYSNGGQSQGRPPLQANEKQEHGKGSRRLSVGDISKKGAASLSPSKKRRSQSMGGALSEAAAVRAAASASAASATELSPRKKARRSLVPGRSILKPAAPSQQHSYDNDSTGTFTTTLYTQNFVTATATAAINKDDDPASSSDEAEVGGHDHAGTTTMNMTMAADMTRRMSRRVSFAPTAQMREFSKEDEFCGDDSLSNIGGASSSSPARTKADQQPSVYIPGLSNALDARGVTGPINSNASTTASPSPAKPTHGRRRSSSIRTSNGHRRRSSVANAQSLVESFNAAPREPTASQESASASVDQSLSTIMPIGDESNMLSNESAMDLADTSDMTTAFKSHFVFPSTSSSQQSQSQTSLDSQEASFAASSANASNVMDMADDDVTSAFALNTHLFGAPSPARTLPSTNIFTQPSPSHLSAASPFRLSTTSQPVSPAAHRRRQSHSPSKKVQQQRRESEIKAAWEAEAVRRRSAIYSHSTDSAPGPVVVTSSQEERTHREYHVPLGQEGIDEEDIAQLQRERARRGSAAFFASRQSIESSKVSLFGTSVTETDTSVFAVHHGSDAGNEGQDNRFSPDGDEENDDQTMDMSIVTDTRRVSSVFAVFSDRRQSTDSITATTSRIEEVEDDSPSPMKTGSLYPSIQDLQKETNHLQSPTPGDRALAFLDGDDEDDYNQTLGADNTADQQSAPVQQSEQELPEENVTGEGSPTEPEQDGKAPAEVIVQEEEEEVVAQPAPFNVYDFQRHRLSIVPERRDEEELEEEDEELEDDDHTQDMEETAVYGSVLHQNPVRRLSMAHPRASLAPVSAPASPPKSPARSPARSSRSPAKQNMSSPPKLPSPAKQMEARRKSLSPEVTKSTIPQPASVLKGRHSLSIPSVPPMAFTSLNEDGPQVQADSLFKTVTSGSGVAQSVPSMGMSISSGALPSPARPPKSPSMRTGLTPDMRRLTSDEGRRKSTLNMLASPGPMKALSALSGRESLAPTSEPFFDENAPHESEERPKISLDQFLSLTDMQFMDGLLSVSQAPGAGLKRKNGARPSLERGPSNALGGVSLADQISASAAVLPFLEGYRMMVSELRKSLRENSDVLDEMEEQIEEETPSLFLDYASASEEDRAMLDTHFKVTRAYYRLQTRSEWYMFRNGVSTSIGEMLHGHLEGLTTDKAIIDETYRRLTSDHLPTLRERAKDLAEELAKEKARQQELQECDQEHLNELRIAIKEQNSTIEDYKRDVAQTEGTLERLQQKEEELDSHAAECKDAIETSKRVCDEVRYYTKTELWRLQDELDLLQYLHGWQLTQYDSTRIELCHHNEISITILFGSTGQVEDFELILLESRTSEAHDQNSSNRALLTGFLFDRLVAHVGPPLSRQPHHKTAKDLLRKISNLWTRARQVRSAFALLAQRYPVHMSMLTKKSRSSGQPFLRASARVYAEAARAEFFVTFELTGEEINDAGPHGADLEDCVQDLGVSVEVKYGNVDREELSCIVRERVANAGNVALLEACQEAEARYS